MRTIATFCITFLTPAAALASAVAPAPVAGALGPIGLGVAAAGYIGYRIWKSRQD